MINFIKKTIMANKAKLKVESIIEKRPTAWHIDFGNNGEHWIPFTFIQDFKPWTKEIVIDTWILDEKGIMYKAL
jgi:hypothetical protein